MYNSRIPEGIDIKFKVDPDLSRRGITALEASILPGRSYSIIETKPVDGQRRWKIKGEFGSMRFKTVQLSEFGVNNILYLIPMKFLKVK